MNELKSLGVCILLAAYIVGFSIVVLREGSDSAVGNIKTFLLLSIIGGMALYAFLMVVIHA